MYKALEELKSEAIGSCMEASLKNPTRTLREHVDSTQRASLDVIFAEGISSV